MQQCDIAIVGGGLAGASLAIALAPLGLQIRVIEAAAFKAAAQPSYDDRTLVLSHSSCRILQGIGLWPLLEPDTTAICSVLVTELGRPGRVMLDPAELGLAEFGRVVEARRFGHVVTRRLTGLPNVGVISPARVQGLDSGADNTCLHIDTGHAGDKLSARLVVAADGANSFIRRLLQIPTQIRDYGQCAVICNVTPEQEHQGRAFECLTATGPLAVLPHTGSRCGLVWTVNSSRAEHVLSLGDTEFLGQAQARFGTELGNFLKVGRRSAYPLKLVRARQDIRDRLVILGNAAHAIHPIGAQGFNLALRDVAVLAELLADNPGTDPGDIELLRRYSHWRKPDQHRTISWSDGMVRLFSHHSAFLSGVRTAAFMAHELLPGVRRRTANRAMGYHGRLPRLALGEPLVPA